MEQTSEASLLPVPKGQDEVEMIKKRSKHEVECEASETSGAMTNN